MDKAAHEVGTTANETRWIEAESLQGHSRGRRRHEESNHQDQEDDGNEDEDDEDAHSTLNDLFADPDPYETFTYQWTMPDGGCAILDSTDDAEKKMTTICLTVTGHKAENGQTLSSTGLTVWRASQILADWLIEQHSMGMPSNSTNNGVVVVEPQEPGHNQPSQRQLPLFTCTTGSGDNRHNKNVSVLELGAGLGIPGMLCHKLGAASTILTDGDTDTLANLRRNVAQNCNNESSSSSNNSGSTTTIECQQLVWGNQEHIDRLLQCRRRQRTEDDEERLLGAATASALFDVILGSDIIYVKEVVDPLFQTVQQLLRRSTSTSNDNSSSNHSAIFVLAFCQRHVPIALVLDTAREYGFVCDQRPVCSTESSPDGVYIFSLPEL